MPSMEELGDTLNVSEIMRWKDEQKKSIFTRDLLLQITYAIITIPLALYIVYFVPIRIAYGLEFQSWTDSLDIILIVFVFLESVARYFIQSTNQPVISIENWTFWALDIVSLVPTLVMHLTRTPFSTWIEGIGDPIDESGIRFIHLLTLCKMPTIMLHNKRLLESIQLLIRSRSHVLSVFCNHLVLITTMAHWISCFYISMLLNEDEHWSWRSSLANASEVLKMDDIYVTAMYWAFSTLATVGLGDVAATTDAEKLYSLLVFFMGASLYAYFLSHATAAYREAQDRAAAKDAKVNVCRLFIRETQCPPSLAQKILVHVLRANQEEKERKMLSFLSPAVRSQVMVYIHRKMMRKVPVFQRMPVEVAAAIVACWQTVYFSKGECVTFEGDEADEFYIILEGQAVSDSGSNYKKGGFIAPQEPNKYYENTIRVTSSVMHVQAVKYHDIEQFSVEQPRLMHYLKRHLSNDRLRSTVSLMPNGSSKDDSKMSLIERYQEMLDQHQALLDKMKESL